MIKRSIAALSLAGVLGSAGLAFAQTAPPSPAPGQPAPMHRGHGMARLQHKLGLTDDQVTAIKAAYAKHRDEQRQAWQALGKAQGELRQLALNGQDTAAKAAEVQQLLGQTVAVRVKVLQEIGPILTPEQRAKFAEARMHHGHRGYRKASVQS
jgi:Spy/CpxP family protein refolding chaperone